MQMNEAEEEQKFKQTLTDFLLANGLVTSGDIDFKYDPFKLYQLVCRRGGFNVPLVAFRPASTAKSGVKSASS